jgi:hypothetical protein
MAGFMAGLRGFLAGSVWVARYWPGVARAKTSFSAHAHETAGWWVVAAEGCGETGGFRGGW